MPREPVDHVRIGRRVVRRRAKGMDAAAVAQALEDARFDARLDSRHEHLADDEAGRAEPAEWERIDQLLADPAPDTVYDTDADDVVQEEFAADAAAADAREAELREAARIAARPMSSRRCASSAPWTNSSCGPPRTCRKTSTPGSPHALAAHLGYYADPAVRAAAADLLPTHLLTHAALLTELPHLAPNAGVDQLAFAARLAAADPEATGDLAAFLARARPGDGMIPSV
ncbi:hypothetical protein ACFYSF_46105 [Streptomyces canus]|uniref:hypothetical protein n=1 Tax=Streptomyces canus TaxID=58343 RepID=UPI0036B7D846